MVARVTQRARSKMGFPCANRRYNLSYSLAMVTQTSKPRRADAVIQFSVFTPNRLGRLHDLIRLLNARSVHVLGLMVLDTTDSAIIRVVVDDPDRARELLVQEGFPFTESYLVVVEVNSADLNRLMAALLEAELNINYLYSFLPQPQGKPVVGLSMEDNETAEQALKRHQFRTLKQADISR
jgi:hypothetical protein